VGVPKGLLREFDATTSTCQHLSGRFGKKLCGQTKRRACVERGEPLRERFHGEGTACRHQDGQSNNTSEKRDSAAGRGLCEAFLKRREVVIFCRGYLAYRRGNKWDRRFEKKISEVSGGGVPKKRTLLYGSATFCLARGLASLAPKEVPYHNYKPKRRGSD